jgi:hypothetical protein
VVANLIGRRNARRANNAPRCSGCRRDEPSITTRPRCSPAEAVKHAFSASVIRIQFQTKGSGYNTRLPPRFFAHIRAKLLRAHLRSGLNLVPCVE